MPITTATTGVGINVDGLEEELWSTMNGVLESRKNGLVDFLRSQWPNPSNSGPQASGRPSQSTGASSEALDIVTSGSGSTLTVEFVVNDNVNPSTGQPASEYAEYVHYTGAPTGSAADAADRNFNMTMQAIIDDIATAVSARVARLTEAA